MGGREQLVLGKVSFKLEVDVAMLTPAELHHIKVHSTDVHKPRIRGVLLLRQHDDTISGIRVLPDTRDEGNSIGVHGQTVRGETSAHGQ